MKFMIRGRTKKWIPLHATVYAKNKIQARGKFRKMTHALNERGEKTVIYAFDYRTVTHIPKE